MKFRLAALLVGVAFTTSARAEDEITYFDDAGKSAVARGAIREETPREVVVQTARGQVRIGVHQIDNLKYDGQSAQITAARSIERQGRFEDAFAEYEKIAEDVPDDKPNLEAALAFAMFRCAAGAAIADPKLAERALKLYQQSIEKFRDTRHYYPMQETMGRVYLAMGDFDKAAEVLRVLKEVDWPGFKEKGTVYEGLAALRQKRLGEAKKAFEEVINSTSNDRESAYQKKIAQVYLGELMVADGKPAEAEKLLKDSLAGVSAEETFVKALGHNALGDALMASGKTEEAIIEGYLWVPTIFYRHPDQLARAYYHLSRALPMTGRKEQGEKMAHELRERFPESEWTKKLASP